MTTTGTTIWKHKGHKSIDEVRKMVMKWKEWIKPLVVGNAVVFLAPLISSWMPSAFAVPLVAGFTFASLASAGLAAFVGEMVAEQFM